MGVKHTAKDSVFRDLFEQPENLLELYKTLHAEDNDVTVNDLKIITMQQILMDGIYNDLGFLVKDRLMVLVEAQSTWSDNIVIRSLIYLMSTYQEYLNSCDANLYGSAPVHLPRPELYMIYTKEQGDHPDVLSLKERFFPGVECAIDARLNVIYLDDSDSIINQYIGFCMVFDEQRKLYGRSLQAIRETIRICIDKKLLGEYLKNRRTEVEDIMFTLFDQERVTEIAASEAAKVAAKEARLGSFMEVALSMLKKNMHLDVITDITHLSADEVRKLAADNGLSVV